MFYNGAVIPLLHEGEINSISTIQEQRATLFHVLDVVHPHTHLVLLVHMLGGVSREEQGVTNPFPEV